MYLSESGISCSYYRKEARNNLIDILNTFGAQIFENELHSRNNNITKLREGIIMYNSHQVGDRYGWIEFLQRASLPLKPLDDL